MHSDWQDLRASAGSRTTLKPGPKATVLWWPRICALGCGRNDFILRKTWFERLFYPENVVCSNDSPSSRLSLRT